MTKTSSLLALLISAACALPLAAQAETLPSGVGIEHLKVGTGAQPTAASTVKVRYRGTLADGKEFDSSYKRGEPISFPLKGVIPCWTQGVQTMKVGGKARLVCPPDTAYGARGAGGVIPPNATLTFEIELLDVASR
jgi:FKBP-type peptidyl-prolyl cis-trans isomerase FkpA